MIVDMSFGEDSLFHSIYMLGTPKEWSAMGEYIRKAIQEGQISIEVDSEGSPNHYDYRARTILIRRTDEPKAVFRILAPYLLEITGAANVLEVVAMNVVKVGYEFSYMKLDDLILGDYIAEANCHASFMAPGSPPSRLDNDRENC